MIPSFTMEIFIQDHEQFFTVARRRVEAEAKEAQSWLWHIILESGVSTDSVKIERIVRCFRTAFGSFGVPLISHRSVVDLLKTSTTLSCNYIAYQKKNKPVNWDHLCEKAFLDLKAVSTDHASSPSLTAVPSCILTQVIFVLVEYCRRAIGYNPRTL